MDAYWEQPAPVNLARWVECGWVLQSSGATAEHRVPPDGCLDILYDRLHGLRAVGAMTAEQRFSFPEGVCLTGIRLRPGMAGTFLGAPASEITDASAPLADLWPHRA